MCSSPNNTEGQQTAQTPPTVEVTPPDSKAEDNDETEEHTDGEWLGGRYE